MWMSKKSVEHVLFVLLFGLIGNALLPSSSASSQEHSSGILCDQLSIQIIDRKEYAGGWNYNTELAANAYALFAAASYDAYEPRNEGESRAFRIDDSHPDLAGAAKYGTLGWYRAEARHSNMSGLSYDVYYKKGASVLDVLVAYRGTDGWVDVDLLANLSWLTQWINPWDQYRQARYEFDEVVERAKAAADGKPLRLVVTGHSLGGGLAQYVAYTHDCTSAVVFNSSFVTNTLLTVQINKNPRVIRIYEKGDKFEELAPKIVNSDEEAVYRFDATELQKSAAKNPEFVYQHSMERLAAGMSRMALACVSQAKVRGCEIADDASVADVLYCKRYWGYRWSNDSKAKEATFDEVCNRQ